MYRRGVMGSVAYLEINKKVNAVMVHMDAIIYRDATLFRRLHTDLGHNLSLFMKYKYQGAKRRCKTTKLLNFVDRQMGRSRNILSTRYCKFLTTFGYPLYRLSAR